MYRVAIVLVLLALLVAVSPCLLKDPSTRCEGRRRGSSILHKQPVIDGHNDLPGQIRKIEGNQLKHFHFDRDLSKVPKWKNCSMCGTDLPRLKTGHVGAQFWSAFVYCRTQFKDAVEQTLEQIDVIKRLCDRYPEHLQFVDSAAGIEAAIRNRKIASLIGVEGGHSIGSRLSVLRSLYSLGARYLTLTHSCSTPWSTTSPVEENKPLRDKGLTEWGKAVVLEMNRLGMMVDLSHVSYQTMVDAIHVSRAPVLFSHSSAHVVCPIPRNVQDDVLQLLNTCGCGDCGKRNNETKNGGIVMVNFYSKFVNCDPSREATIQDVADHINHIRRVAGVNHVGVGADYDGIYTRPVGLEDVSTYPALFDLLAKTDEGEPNYWSDEDLIKLAGGNLLRVFRAVETVRDRLALERELPIEEWIPQESLGGNLQCRT